MNLCVGIDIGNAKTELAFEQENQLTLIRQPSVIMNLTQTPEANDLPVKQVIENLFQNLIVNISSPAISRNGDYVVGQKAMQHNGIKDTMTISSGNKSNHDLPIIESLTLVAASAVKSHYKKEGQLPDNLSIELKMATAIPSSEYNKQAAKTLEGRFMNRHNLILYVGEYQVPVSINITVCKVTEEGRTSMLSFFNSEADILSEYNNTYKDNKKPSDFKKVRTLHADIGDGTSELVVIEGASPVQDLSDGKKLGVGHASITATKLLKKKLNISDTFTRQQFQEWLKKDNEKGQIARACMKEATYSVSRAIFVEITDAYQELAGSDVDYIFVHGGGSITFKEDLYNDLLKFAESNHIRIVWIPEKYATTMNSVGTYQLAKMICKKK